MIRKSLLFNLCRGSNFEMTNSLVFCSCFLQPPVAVYVNPHCILFNEVLIDSRLANKPIKIFKSVAILSFDSCFFSYLRLN
jgi:hypothetical protein